MDRKWIAIIGIFSSNAMLVSCSEDTSNSAVVTPVSSSTETSTTDTSIPAAEVVSCTPVAVPDAPPAAGQLTFSIPSDADPCTVKGYVVGFQTQLKAIRGEGDKFFINNVPGGSHDIVILAGTLAVSTLTDASKVPDRGIRLKAERILAGVKTEKDTAVELPALGSISGTVKLNGLSDHAGIDVYVPGTGFLAKTDAAGKFSISAVPAGEHNLYFEKDGYQRGRIEGIKVAGGAVRDIGTTVLTVDTGTEGEIIIENSATRFGSKTVSLNLSASNDAILMRISESDVFTNARWVPFQTSTAYTFATIGAKVLYAQFSNANGLLSATYSAAIEIYSEFSEFQPAFTIESGAGTGGNGLFRNRTLTLTSEPRESYRIVIQVAQGGTDTNYTPYILDGTTIDVTPTTVGAGVWTFRADASCGGSAAIIVHFVNDIEENSKTTTTYVPRDCI